LDDLLANVSHVVARAARHVGFVMAVNDSAVLQRIEFVPVSDARVLVVVVSTNGQVTQKAVEVGEHLSSDELAHAARYLNTEFAGLRLREVREQVLVRLHRGADAVRRDAGAFAAAGAGVAGRCVGQPAFHVEGAASLLDDDADRVSPVHAARPARDDGREGTDGAPADAVHRRSRA
jgi:heat-inducible transcriptional repressor